MSASSGSIATRLTLERAVAATGRGATLTLFGIPVRFGPSCFFATALGAWTFADAVLPVAAPGRSLLAYAGGGIAVAVLLLMSVVFHELGHLLAARRARIGVRRLSLGLVGGTAELERAPRTAGELLRLAAAGPLASGAAAAVSAVIHVILVESDADPLAAAIFALAAAGNLALAALNLLPALPLDGGHVLVAALSPLVGQDRATALAIGLGRLLGGSAVALGLLASASGDAGVALWLTLLGVVVWHHAARRHAATKPGVESTRRVTAVVSVDPPAARAA